MNRNSLLLAALLGLFTTVGALAQAPPPNKILDDKFGFRDLKFETDSATVTGLVPVERNGQRIVYSRPTDNMKIGKATISKIQYVFYKGQLMEVDVVTKGMLNSRNLRETLEDNYGQGSFLNATSPNRFWDGKLTKMTYDENGTFDARVRMYHRKLYDSYQQEAKATQKKISSDL